MMWAPLSMPERSEGDSVSPEWTKKVVPLARSALTTRGEPGEAAAPVELLHAVDVVGLDEGDGELLGERLRRPHGRREKRDCGEPQDA